MSKLSSRNDETIQSQESKILSRARFEPQSLGCVPVVIVASEVLWSEARVWMRWENMREIPKMPFLINKRINTELFDWAALERLGSEIRPLEWSESWHLMIGGASIPYAEMDLKSVRMKDQVSTYLEMSLTGMR